MCVRYVRTFGQIHYFPPNCPVLIMVSNGEQLLMCVCGLASGSCSGRSRPSKVERIDPGLPSGGGRIDTCLK